MEASVLFAAGKLKCSHRVASLRAPGTFLGAVYLNDIINYLLRLSQINKFIKASLSIRPQASAEKAFSRGFVLILATSGSSHDKATAVRGIAVLIARWLPCKRFEIEMWVMASLGPRRAFVCITRMEFNMITALVSLPRVAGSFETFAENWVFIFIKMHNMVPFDGTTCTYKVGIPSTQNRNCHAANRIPEKTWRHDTYTPMPLMKW